MEKKIQSYKILLLILLSFFSFFINYYYGNIGVFPIDTFAFFDTGYNILIDRHPFRDVWITSGFLVDYIQAAFFAIFGLQWSSAVIHASAINLLVSVLFYIILIKHGLNFFFCFFLFYITFYPLLYSFRNSFCIYSFIRDIFNFNINFYASNKKSIKFILVSSTYFYGVIFFMYANTISLH